MWCDILTETESTTKDQTSLHAGLPTSHRQQGHQGLGLLSEQRGSAKRQHGGPKPTRVARTVGGGTEYRVPSVSSAKIYTEYGVRSSVSTRSLKLSNAAPGP